MNVEIRAACEDEIPALISAYEWLFAPPGAPPAFGWDERRAAVALGQAIGSHDSVVLIADIGGQLVGFLTGYLDIHSVRFGYRAWIEDFAVHPDWRSQGIGRRMLDAAKGWARECGATHLELDSALTRTDAHRFYDREGAAARSYSFQWPL
jgi:GNAT superfamily N-acetyltransferase